MKILLWGTRNWKESHLAKNHDFSIFCLHINEKRMVQKQLFFECRDKKLLSFDQIFTFLIIRFFQPTEKCKKSHFQKTKIFMFFSNIINFVHFPLFFFLSKSVSFGKFLIFFRLRRLLRMPRKLPTLPLPEPPSSPVISKKMKKSVKMSKLC